MTARRRQRAVATAFTIDEHNRLFAGLVPPIRLPVGNNGGDGSFWWQIEKRDRPMPPPPRRARARRRSDADQRRQTGAHEREPAGDGPGQKRSTIVYLEPHHTPFPGPLEIVVQPYTGPGTRLTFR